MQEIGSVYVGDGPKLMGGGIEAMTYAGLAPVVVTDPPFNIGYRYKGFSGDVQQVPQRSLQTAAARAVQHGGAPYPARRH